MLRRHTARVSRECAGIERISLQQQARWWAILEWTSNSVDIVPCLTHLTVVGGHQQNFSNICHHCATFFGCAHVNCHDPVHLHDPSPSSDLLPFNRCGQMPRPQLQRHRCVSSFLSRCPVSLPLSWLVHSRRLRWQQLFSSCAFPVSHRSYLLLSRAVASGEGNSSSSFLPSPPCPSPLSLVDSRRLRQRQFFSSSSLLPFLLSLSPFAFLSFPLPPLCPWRFHYYPGLWPPGRRPVGHSSVVLSRSPSRDLCSALARPCKHFSPSAIPPTKTQRFPESPSVRTRKRFLLTPNPVSFQHSPRQLGCCQPVPARITAAQPAPRSACAPRSNTANGEGRTAADGAHRGGTAGGTAVVPQLAGRRLQPTQPTVPQVQTLTAAPTYVTSSFPAACAHPTTAPNGLCLPCSAHPMRACAARPIGKPAGGRSVSRR